jgi:hypothetical protein
MPKIIAAGGNPAIFDDDTKFLEYTGRMGGVIGACFRIQWHGMQSCVKDRASSQPQYSAAL